MGHLRAKAVTVSWLVESCRAGRVLATDGHEITLQSGRPARTGSGSGARRPSPVNLDGATSLSTIFAGSRSAMASKPIIPEAIVEETRYPGRAARETRPAGAGSGDNPDRASRRKMRKRHLAGMTFTLSHALREDEKRKAENIIVEHGGTIATSAADGLGSQAKDRAGKLYAICPHGQSTNTFGLPAFASPSARSDNSGSKTNVTLQWLEDCCHRGSKPGDTPDPEASPAFTPLPFKLPLPGADECVVCLSQFVNPVRRQIRTLLTLLGANDQERMSKRSTTILICKEPRGEKYDRAVEWRIPVVTVDWLHKCAKSGELRNPRKGSNLLKQECSARPQDGVSEARPKAEADGPAHGDQQSARGERDTSPQAIDEKAAEIAAPSAPRQGDGHDEITEHHGSGSPRGVSATSSQQHRAARSSQPLPLVHSASVTAPAAGSQEASPMALEAGTKPAEEDAAAVGQQAAPEARMDDAQVAARPARSDFKLETAGAKRLLESGSSSSPSQTAKKRRTSDGAENGEVESANTDAESDGAKPQRADARRAEVQHVEESDADKGQEKKVQERPLEQEQEPPAAPAQQDEDREQAADSSSPPKDSPRVLKRSASESHVTDGGGKENVVNAVGEDGRPASAPDPPTEPISSPQAATSSQQKQKPDLSLLVKDFKLKFQKKKSETPREDPFLPPPARSTSFNGAEQRSVTRSEVERDTTERPSGNSKRRRQRQAARGRGVDAATASAVRSRLTARKGQHSESISTLDSGTMGTGMSDDEDMYAESQMVVYDRSAGPTNAAAVQLSRGAARGIPEPAAAATDSADQTINVHSEGFGLREDSQPRRTTRRSSAAAAGNNAANPKPQQPAVSAPEQRTHVFMVSGLSPSEKKQAIADIKKLGGKISSAVEWDHSCTHLIIKQAKRVEKMVRKTNPLPPHTGA